MSAVIHFSPDLSGWLVENLDRGRTPAQLVATMVDERMDAHVARAIVGAFVTARQAGASLPTNSVVIDETTLGYVRELRRLTAEPRIGTHDTAVRVIARAQGFALGLLANVLSPDECHALIERARPRLVPSTVVDPATGKDVVAQHRQSHGMFFRPAEDPFIAKLDRRFAEIMSMPIENGEGIQVLRYTAGGFSTPHFDFLNPANAANQASVARSGQRVSTLIVYLNDVARGGETIFPKIGWSITPQAGHAAHFEYCNSLGQVDELSVHGAEPVTGGEKWLATKWMRERRFTAAPAAAQ